MIIINLVCYFSVLLFECFREKITGRNTVIFTERLQFHWSHIPSEEFLMMPCAKPQTESSWFANTRIKDIPSPTWTPKSVKTSKIKYFPLFFQMIYILLNFNTLYKLFVINHVYWKFTLWLVYVLNLDSLSIDHQIKLLWLVWNFKQSTVESYYGIAR